MENINVITQSNGKKYSIRNHRNRVLYPEEWFKFADALRTYQRPTFDILINTGARIKEARGIRKNHIDFVNKRISLIDTKIRARKKEKTPIPRIIPISTQFSRRLKGYFNDNEQIHFLSNPAANIAMKKALKKANIKDYYMLSVHNVRKTIETWLLALGIEPVKLMLHFGHNVSTATKHYISPDAFSFKEKQMIRDVIGDLYQN